MKKILDELLRGNIQPALDNREIINNEVIRLISLDQWDTNDIKLAEILMNIANISYNNYDSDLLPIEDGIYDCFSEKYKKYKPNWFGSKPIYIKPTHGEATNVEESKTKWFKKIDDDTYNKYKSLMFGEIITKIPQIPSENYFEDIRYDKNITKRLRDTTTSYPELVGTLNKYKYVLNKQAEEKGVLNQSNVTVLERDFMKPLLENGVISSNGESIEMIASLKYDGVSIVATCTDIILQAETRGDTQESVSADVTPIFYGYRFKNAPKIKDPIGIKFEAIMTYDNLIKFNKLKNYNYKNCRTAIIGLLGSSDAWKYRDLITLVPLQTNCGFKDRIAEAEFINKYFTNDVSFNYSILYGDYVSLMFQIKKYVEEAEFCRQFLNFMYDGVVLEFTADYIRQHLGRFNSVNQFSAAIKFNPLKKQTIFTGYSYTVGKTGRITPMINYIPVEFFGTIHPQSSGHSLARFKELNLAKGDIIDVEYVNDVITYVTKPDNSHNNRNPEPKEHFIEFCPSCGTKLEISKTGDSVRCPNINCPERRIKNIVSGLSILGVTGFAEESLCKIGIMTLREIFEANVEKFSILGPNDMYNLKNQLDTILSNPVYDYKVLSAIGIDNCGIDTWSKIFRSITLKEFLEIYNSIDRYNTLFTILTHINGIGKITTDNIINSIQYFLDDIIWAVDHMNIIDTKGVASGPKVRITGFRDKELLEQLNSYGYNATDGSVTRDTLFLIIPYEGYSSGAKVRNAKKYGIKMIPADYIRNHMEDFII